MNPRFRCKSDGRSHKLDGAAHSPMQEQRTVGLPSWYATLSFLPLPLRPLPPSTPQKTICFSALSIFLGPTVHCARHLSRFLCFYQVWRWLSSPRPYFLSRSHFGCPHAPPLGGFLFSFWFLSSFSLGAPPCRQNPHTRQLIHPPTHRGRGRETLARRPVACRQVVDLPRHDSFGRCHAKWPRCPNDDDAPVTSDVNVSVGSQALSAVRPGPVVTPRGRR